MKMYVGTKALKAEQMNLGVYNALRNWELPKNEVPHTPGYYLEYSDGYKSWSPKDQFEDAYRKDGDFTFGHAMWLLEHDYLVTRTGWRGKGMYLFLVEADGNCQQYIGMMTPEGTVVPWVCSQSCMAASDWAIVV